MVPLTQIVDSPVFVVAGGGTGGHLYPALAVADALRKRIANARFVFFGTKRPMDAQILRAYDGELVAQTLPPLSRLPWRWPSIYLGFRRSSLHCRSRLLGDRPVAVLGTGGLASVPAVRQATRLKIPVILLNPDAIPGKANRFLARSADLVAVQWEDTLPRLPRGVRAQVLGCGIRPEFQTTTRKQGIEHFGLDPNRKTLLVTGASQGAKTINEAVLANISCIESYPDWQIIHLTGELDYERVLHAYEDRSFRAVVLKFTNRMAEALAASDLVVSRAGASTLAEITALGRPSILMPYPFHRDRHQRANAECVERAGAAAIVDDQIDATRNGPALGAILAPLLADSARRTAMAAASRSLGRPEAADQIAQKILDLIRDGVAFSARIVTQPMTA